MPRVLVVDDSPTARALIVAILSDDQSLSVVGEASSGDEAVQMTAHLRPDVITMDINMPGLNGFEATKQIMIETPTPIVIVSASAMVGEVAAGMRALRAGALTLVRKPPGPEASNYEQACDELIETVSSMADVKVVRHFRPPESDSAQLATPGLVTTPSSAAVASQADPAHSAGGEVQPSHGPTSTDRRAGKHLAIVSGVVALAASTGGPPAIQQVLAELPSDFPLPILVVQHIAKGFSRGLVQWLDSTVTLPVKTASQGTPLCAGEVYVAAEDGHLGVSMNRHIEISDDPPIAGFRPSATYLFNSLAGVYRDGVLAVIMTGMGSDGLTGLRAVKQCRGTVIAQDEATSVVFGMPGAAVDANVVDDIVGLDRIAHGIQQFARRRSNR